jgi:lysozyme family protein
MSIKSIIDCIIGREGGYVDNPNDRGGKTCWGVTEAVARQNGYAGDMRNLPRAFAFALYERRYVNDPGFAPIIKLSEPIAEELVDTGVNMGTSIPAPWLQRILNALNRQGKDYADIVVDGQIGPATLHSLSCLLAKRSFEGEQAVLRLLNCLQGARYLEISEARGQNEEFLFGWIMNRVEVV